MITENFQKFLLKVARDNVNSISRTSSRISVPKEGATNNELSLKGLGVFVTIKLSKILRGCVGSVTSKNSVISEVIRQSHNAAYADIRFPPVTSAELDYLEYEITLLNKPSPVKVLSEIAIGEHGIVIQKNGKRSVFLPHVPIEMNWDLTQTLEKLCLKAGLEKHDWESGANFQKFSGFKFSK